MTNAQADEGLPGRLEIPESILRHLREALVPLADEVVDAIVAEIPAYSRLSGRDGGTLREAVQLALGAFLTLAEAQADASVPIAPSTSGAYDLGRGEARSGRSLDALLAAYRIGARVSWRGLSRVAAGEGMPAAAVGAFAELVFAYIDELTAASVAGHGDEIDKTGRARARYLERLGRLLLEGAGAADLDAAAERAAWPASDTLTAVVLDGAAATSVRRRLDARTLTVAGEVVDLDEETVVLLVPDVRAAGRAALRRALDGHGASIGPTLPWREARRSARRAHRARGLRTRPGETIDSDERLVDLVLTADPEALRDLRRRALAQLAGVRPSTRPALEETLRSWLLHQGRRADVARDLHVHPQTVRYRMGLVRERFGDTLDDPATALGLVVALGAATSPADPSGAGHPTDMIGPG